MEILVAAFTVVLVFIAAVKGSTLDPKALLAEIDRVGAEKVVDKMGDKKLEKIFDLIETGADDWLSVAKKMQPGTDAASAEGLVVAVSHSLPKNPSGVLRLTQGKEFQLEEICEPWFFEDDSDEDVKRFTKEAIAAIKSVKDPALKKQRDECLETLRK